uniref:Uncharacterized protein n=1 Tax=Mycena chlorophos TaxID=658473 RepID=A0ABQ0M7M2_MYCCL|nr:predicted protein [Mycena chlorophos]
MRLHSVSVSTFVATSKLEPKSTQRILFVKPQAHCRPCVEAMLQERKADLPGDGVSNYTWPSTHVYVHASRLSI